MTATIFNCEFPTDGTTVTFFGGQYMIYENEGEKYIRTNDAELPVLLN